MSDKNYSTKLRELYTPDIVDEVVTFANSDGGVIYIGIREDSTVLGITDPEGVATRAAQDIISTVQPDISPILQVRTVQLKGKDLVAVMVHKGIAKPYSRIGAEKDAPVAHPLPAIFPDTTNGFDENGTCDAELSFSTLRIVMEACELPDDEEELTALGVINDKGYTNLGLLLSDQCPYNIKVTLYKGADKSSIIHSTAIGGSILRQLAETCRLIEKLTGDAYPQDHVNEAVLNALVHRDYSYSGSTLVNIFRDHLEIVSLGGLAAGLSMEAVEIGVSQPRYPKLASALNRIELMDCCASGISMIQCFYSQLGLAADIKAADGAFRITLPDIHSSDETKTSADGYKALVLKRAREKGFVVRADAEEIAGLKTTAAYNLIKELVSDGLLVASGVGKKTIYKIP